jgi:hypothetical protein
MFKAEARVALAASSQGNVCHRGAVTVIVGGQPFAGSI